MNIEQIKEKLKTSEYDFHSEEVMLMELTMRIVI